MSPPRLLDLFCGAGGAAMGYARAGFDVVGVDINPQPRYPFAFHQADAMTFPLDGYDAIHASPPCGDHSDLVTLSGEHGTGWMLRHILWTLDKQRVPWVVENVESADMSGYASVTLCGASFGLSTQSSKGRVWLRRHRQFATSFPTLVPACSCRQGPIIGVYGTGDGGSGRGWKGSFAERQAVMGIEWMNRAELAQAIPPAFTQFIGAQLLAHLGLAA